MKINEVIGVLERFAPRALQESYDNAGVQVGDLSKELTSALLCIDVTEEVVNEAIALGANLIIAHHPLIFKGLKSITGQNYVERIIISAIVNGIAIYAAHTNLDNTFRGVNFINAEKLELKELAVLRAMKGGDLDVSGDKSLDLTDQHGSGIVGRLPEPMDEAHVLQILKECFGCPVIKHSAFRGKQISKIAICGGSASFLIPDAIAAGADLFITGEIKYHDFFGNDEHILLADIGHFESEQYTTALIAAVIKREFPAFECQITKVNTNPINYL